MQEALRLLARAGVPRSRVLHVGDSLDHDVRGAQASGIAAALVPGGVDRVELQRVGVEAACARRGLACPELVLDSLAWE